MRGRTVMVLVLGASASGACGSSGGNACDLERPVTTIEQLQNMGNCGTASHIIANGGSVEGGAELEYLDWTGLTEVTGYIELVFFPNLLEVSAPDLAVVNSPNGVARVAFETNASLHTIDLSALGQLTNWDSTPAGVSLVDLPVLNSVQLQALPIAERMMVHGTGLQALTLSSLTELHLDLQVSSNPSLASLDAPLLVAANTVRIFDNPALATCDAMAVVDRITEASGSAPTTEVRDNMADGCGG